MEYLKVRADLSAAEAVLRLMSSSTVLQRLRREREVILASSPSAEMASGVLQKPTTTREKVASSVYHYLYHYYHHHQYTYTLSKYINVMNICKLSLTVHQVICRQLLLKNKSRETF